LSDPQEQAPGAEPDRVDPEPAIDGALDPGRGPRRWWLLAGGGAVAAVVVVAWLAALGDIDMAGGDSEPAGSRTQTLADSAAESESCRTFVGSTVLTFDPGTVDRLRANGVRMEPISPAMSDGDSVLLPIVAGADVACGTFAGIVGHTGGLRFVAGGRSAEIRRIRINTRTGVVAGLRRSGDRGRMRVASLKLRTAVRERVDGNAVIKGVAIRLSARGAGTLNRELERSAFVPGADIGTMDITAAVR
jgi:hypothetical protein